MGLKLFSNTSVRPLITQSLGGHVTRRTGSVGVERGSVEAEGQEREAFCLVSTTMDRVRRCGRLSQWALHLRVVSYRQVGGMLPVVVVGLRSVEVVPAADPLHRIHRKNRSVKL